MAQSAQKACTYCNKCLINDLENPLGCYEVSRFDGDTFEEKWDNVIKDVMSVFTPPTILEIALFLEEGLSAMDLRSSDTCGENSREKKADTLDRDRRRDSSRDLLSGFRQPIYRRL